MAEFDLLDYQQTVTELVIKCCCERPSAKAFSKVLGELAAESEEVLEQDSSDRSKIACGPGCESCCVVNVSILIPEGLRIAEFLQQQGGERVRQVTERLDLLWREVRGLDDEDRLFMQRKCAFLDAAGCCSIYPVRPLLCRSVTATAAAACRDALTGKLLGEDKPVLMHRFQQSLYLAMFSAVAAGLAECRLENRSYPLSGLVRYLLKHPRAEADWLSGQQLSWLDIY